MYDKNGEKMFYPYKKQPNRNTGRRLWLKKQDVASMASEPGVEYDKKDLLANQKTFQTVYFQRKKYLIKFKVTKDQLIIYEREELFLSLKTRPHASWVF
jgi:hypothetical protein